MPEFKLRVPVTSDSFETSALGQQYDQSHHAADAFQ
jgi:hypothetical protein